ncbi:hypothetical protein ACWGI8_13910 [Streptomyces sp. NPDC054841]
MNRVTRTTLAVAVAALVVPLSGCSSRDSSGFPGSGGSVHASASPSPSEPAHVAAYRAGHRAGKAVYDSSGKGAAIRETVWGGCTRRALAAGRAAEADRGAWVRGCLDGVAHAPENPPTGPVTRRTQDARLLKEFRTWAAESPEGESAGHAKTLATVQLTDRDYDIELSTDYTPAEQTQSPAQVQALADVFVDWWDGDPVGDGGVVRNVLVLGAGGERLFTRRM